MVPATNQPSVLSNDIKSSELREETKRAAVHSAIYLVNISSGPTSRGGPGPSMDWMQPAWNPAFRFVPSFSRRYCFTALTAAIWIHSSVIRISVPDIIYQGLFIPRQSFLNPVNMVGRLAGPPSRQKDRHILPLHPNLPRIFR